MLVLLTTNKNECEFYCIELRDAVPEVQVLIYEYFTN